MWAKLIQLILSYLVLPLFKSFASVVISYWRKKAAEGKTNREIDEGVDKLEEAIDRGEQREALKEILIGVRRRRATQRLQNK